MTNILLPDSAPCRGSAPNVNQVVMLDRQALMQKQWTKARKLCPSASQIQENWPRPRLAISLCRRELRVFCSRA